jgi:hypothetical protein
MGPRKRTGALFLLLASSCHATAPRALGKPDPPAAVSARDEDPLAGLRAFEDSARARTDFAHAETSATALGPDPYVIKYAGPSRLVGLLRGRSALVELDSSLKELHSLPAPPSPTGLAIAADGEIFVVGELSSHIARYRRAPAGELREAGFIELPGVRAMRDVAVGPEGVIYAVEEHDGRLLALARETQMFSGSPGVDSLRCHGPLHVMRVGRVVLVDCLLDHAIVVRSVDRHGFPVAEGEARIVHDGPMWGLDALDDPGGLLVAVGGVEDHPLDRTAGSFGFVDSYVTIYRIRGGDVEKLSEVNTSQLGVVTPKALKLVRLDQQGLGLAVAGYGSDHLARLRWEEAFGAASKPGGSTLGEPLVRLSSIPPGSAMIDALPDGSFVLANPLLDCWIHAGSEGVAIAPAQDNAENRRSAESRLGEALFFTTLMAPWQRSDGRLSRFTCETCHFEGYVDGRTHHTGRGDVLATTKPLLGLLSNRPHFSRALDPDLTTMVDNEFAVASAKSGHAPWFSLSLTDFPWLGQLSVGDDMLGPEGLRAALMTFLMDFAHRPNPSVVVRMPELSEGADAKLGVVRMPELSEGADVKPGDPRVRWTDQERAGAGIFRDKCESCHEARLVADEPASREPFEKWEERVLAPQGAIVWAHAQYAMTGVVPYVNEHGARVVSLRRLYKKYPYFTNGSAKSIRDVLDRVGFDNGRFFHDGAPREAVALGEEEKAELSAFLDLL